VTPLLTLRNVRCRRGGRLLFENLSLELGGGDGILVTGPNGSGKSSLLRLIAGLLRPESGTVEAANLALADDALALDRELPLGRALSFWGGGVDAATEAVGLASLGDVPVRLLSAGQRKRATIARVAASDAKLWLLDEPLNGLDADAAALVAKLIEEHRARGGAVIAASHTPLEGHWTPLELGR
jgi:heme exporter protein A